MVGRSREAVAAVIGPGKTQAGGLFVCLFMVSVLVSVYAYLEHRSRQCAGVGGVLVRKATGGLSCVRSAGR